MARGHPGSDVQLRRCYVDFNLGALGALGIPYRVHCIISSHGSKNEFPCLHSVREVGACLEAQDLFINQHDWYAANDNNIDNHPIIQS